MAGPEPFPLYHDSRASSPFTSMQERMAKRRLPSYRLIAFAAVTSVVFLLFTFRGANEVPQQPHVLQTPVMGMGHGNDIQNGTLGVSLINVDVETSHLTSPQFQQILAVNMPERTDRSDSMILAAALSGLSMDFIDAVRGETILDKALPPGEPRKHFAESNIGSWRAHINALKEVVRRDLTSALILEDDADWDIRIKEQLREFALTSKALTQPLSSNPSSYADSTFPRPQDASSLANNLAFDSLPPTIAPQISPYGDNWDILWVGHCGMKFPSVSTAGSENIPKGRVLHFNDQTVPEREYMGSISDPFELKEQYPSHTRVTHHASDGICSLGYAVTQAGARSLLYWLGLMEMNANYDIMLRSVCEGTSGKGYHTCLTVQPGLFHHHRPAGNKSFESDISPHGNEYREKAMTDNIQKSVRMNFEGLLKGKTDFENQFPDKE
ncbi:hypothetical protein LSUE1_G007461 [Lachnellula suecica]|uniref:Glycosyl transferase family 25 domain-containing protein n=1 Tax=Lachnellula suecica TaxID=602035 RepID=A0A8T9CJR4_9HELO|nr:hypothetical protein LSUE1_G007461 [Lachnellula suecica]